MSEKTGSKKVFWLVIFTALATFSVSALLVNIFERKQEARQPFVRVVELTDETDDPAIWGKNFPQQYDDYRRTVDMVRTRYGGSESMSHSPTQGSCEKIENRLFPALSVRRSARATLVEHALRARFHLWIWRRGGSGLAQLNFFTAPGGPKVGHLPKQASGRPAFEADVGRLRVLHRFPRRARACLHAD